MTSPTLGVPCSPWPLDPHCLPDGWDPENLTADQGAAVAVATEILWRLTAGRFGTCQVTVRPCRKKCADRPGFYGPYGPSTYPYIRDGEWLNIGCGCRSTCGCGPLCELPLPGPVVSISQVLIDGIEVSSATYRVDNARFLVRLAPDCWPECQQLDKPATEEGTFSITYVRGVPVPAGGMRAMSAYAVELWKACANAKGCRLPQRVREITREGISMTLLDPMDFLDRGRTGIAEVDLWLAAVNPTGRRDVTRVYSPDLHQYRRQTAP